ncbi:MAG: sugar phosphate isomerase/epimerase [Propionibacteriales bacterium]|nr:sugar phosphate isomerase/epimerase [Propionibacteriales bacterium]
MSPIDRLSLNQKTVNALGVMESVDLCQRHNIASIGLWREPVAEHGLDATVELIKKAGLRVSSLCRGGWFTETGPAFEDAIEENRRAIEEAQALEAACLCLVVGGLPDGSKDLDGARDQVRRALGLLVPYAVDRGVTLALEPMNPIYAADRGVLSTLGQALDLCESYGPEVGVMVDSFHVWWDPQLHDQLQRAGSRIVSYQVCDWITPLPADTLLARGMMGDGHIDFATLGSWVADAGYTGDIEVEIFNADIWATDPDQVMATMIDRYTRTSDAAD